MLESAQTPPVSSFPDPLTNFSAEEQQGRRNQWWASKAFQDGWRIKVRNLAKHWAANDWTEGGQSLMALRGLMAQFPKEDAVAAAGRFLDTPGRPNPLPQDLWSNAYYRQRFFNYLLCQPLDERRMAWVHELEVAWRCVINEPCSADQAWRHPFLKARKGLLPPGIGDFMLTDGTLDRMEPSFLAGPVFEQALFRNDIPLLDALDVRGIRPDTWGPDFIFYLAQRHLHDGLGRYGNGCDIQARNEWGLNAAHVAAAKLTVWRRDPHSEQGFSRKTPQQMALACHRLAATLIALERLGLDIDAPAPKPPKPRKSDTGANEKRGRRNYKVAKEGETVWDVLNRRERHEVNEPLDLPSGTRAQVESFRLLATIPPGNDELPDFTDVEMDAPAPRPRARL